LGWLILTVTHPTSNSTCLLQIATLIIVFR
jgi:hypothetical protein